MAVFEGSKEEFKKYLGGYCRNKVNTITKSEKNKHNRICEFCGEKAELEAAHVNGFERVKIIEAVLDAAFNNGDKYIVDLDKFEILFTHVHMPITDHFLFLCPTCHKKYDAGLVEENNIDKMEDKASTNKEINNSPLVSAQSSQTKFPEITANSLVDNHFLYIKDKESVQNWIKRVLEYFYDNGIVTQDEINNMHDLQYSINTFGIQYPLLVDTHEETFDNTGLSRYWQKWKLGPYYVCSQWWKQNFSIYQDRINTWINRLTK